jgi:arginyl-tRNA synthetase
LFSEIENRQSNIDNRMNIVSLLQQKFLHALTGLAADPAAFAGMVKPAQDPKHGDYQANCAMPLAKQLNKPPREVAQQIVARLELGDMLETPEVAGPGFINLRLKNDWLAGNIQRIAADERLGVTAAAPPRNFVIDFSGPNVAKPMHVGHLRSTIIGDALTRLLRFLGHKVISDNHLGDWGTQFGILLYGYKNFRDDQAFAADPVRELNRLYIKVRQMMRGGDEDDDNPDPVAAACRAETARLHSGDAENLALWKQFMPACLEEIERVYRKLDVKFDHTLGESFYNDQLPAVVKDLESRGIAERSKGAVVIFFGAKPAGDEQPNEPPALIQKTDGAFTYTTTDLATIRHRAETFKADAILYVVDSRQALHFKNLFEAARRWGYTKMALEHISFGSVLGPDGKPIKTREGGAVELGELLDEAIQRGQQVYEQTRKERQERGEEVPDLSDQERRQIAEVVGIGAVKYADLSQNRTSDYKFNWDKMLAMDGNTATYMQYAYVRNRGIFRKGEVQEAPFRTKPPKPVLEHPAERALALQLLRFEEALTSAADEYKPSQITAYLWDLAKSYSVFFQNCPVLKAETPQLRESRLLLCDLTARVVRKSLELLGIKTVERM